MTIKTTTFAALLALAGLLPAGATTEDLLDRMAAVNPNLHTFTATLHAHVTMKSFPFLAADLVGTYYYKEPDKTKVAFTGGLPIIAKQFDKLYAHIESPARWRAVYVVKLISDDGTTASFELTPRKHGNVTHIDASVNDASATVKSMRWNYENGGYATMTNEYGRVAGYLVVRSQTGHVDEPGYIADLSSTIDHYTMNPALPDSVFSGD